LIMKLLLTLACLASVSGLRQRRKNHVESNATALVRGVGLKGADCDQLEGIVVGGRDIGQAAVLLCRFWPASFGEFPVENAKTIADLFNGATDLWEKIKELAKGRPGGSPFCWKRLGVREALGMLQLDGQLHMHMNTSEAEVATEVAMSSDCDMEVLGRCYGSCPSGMKPAAFIGSFSPVCSTACVQSTHQTPCGFGCATGVGSCVQTLMDQVTVVARSVGQVASYLSGNPAISAVVDQVLRLAEFFIDVVFKVVRVAKHVWNEWPREHVELGLIIALVQFVLEHAKTIGQDFLQLNEMFGETMEMILELIDTEFDWQEINLKFISDTILKHGRQILGAAGEFAQAFVFPRCSVTSDTNPDYDCNGNGENDCRDWSYRSARCHDNGGQCEYRYKFGDMLLDHSCRCKNSRK